MLAVDFYGLFKSSGIYKDEAGNKQYNRESEAYKLIAAMPEINGELLNEFDLALRSDAYSVNPRGESKLYSGSIYVLIGSGVYSAGEGFAMFCKGSGFATLVGSNTSGDGGVLHMREFALPNTGLLIRFSTMYSLNLDGTSNTLGTTPDYRAPVGVSALDACLEFIDLR